jgi:hypothetical protein
MLANATKGFSFVLLFHRLQTLLKTTRYEKLPPKPNKAFMHFNDNFGSIYERKRANTHHFYCQRFGFTLQ